MGFYEIDPNSLPESSQYYHNVLVITIAVASNLWTESFSSIWYLNDITSARPMAICIYAENIPAEEECDWELTYYPHSIVEVQVDGEIVWYDEDEEDEFSI